jgi:hypothetical protein
VNKRQSENLKGWSSIQRIVLIRAQFGVAYVRLESFVVKMKLVMTDDAISCTQLYKAGEPQILFSETGQQLPRDDESDNKTL